MRCILCDRCKKIVEDERKIKVITFVRPLSTSPGSKCPNRADDRQMNDHIWTKEVCPTCAEEFEDFMDPAVTPDEPSVTPPEEKPEEPETDSESNGDGDDDGDDGLPE